MHICTSREWELSIFETTLLSFVCLLQDELKIGYDVEEDFLPDQYDNYDDESYIDGLLTDGMIPVDASEMFGDEVIGYSLR